LRRGKDAPALLESVASSGSASFNIFLFRRRDLGVRRSQGWIFGFEGLFSGGADKLAVNVQSSDAPGILWLL
jgi:hypothetical protein